MRRLYFERGYISSVSFCPPATAVFLRLHGTELVSLPPVCVYPKRMIYETTPKQTMLGTWRIELVGDGATWLLRWKSRGESWMTCHGYGSAEAASAAVGVGRTGISEWDANEINSEKFTLDLWLQSFAAPAGTLQTL